MKHQIQAANGAAWFFQGYLDNMYTTYEAVGGSAEALSAVDGQGGGRLFWMARSRRNKSLPQLWN